MWIKLRQASHLGEKQEMTINLKRDQQPDRRRWPRQRLRTDGDAAADRSTSDGDSALGRIARNAAVETDGWTSHLSWPKLPGEAKLTKGRLASARAPIRTLKRSKPQERIAQRVVANRGTSTPPGWRQLSP